MKWNEMECNGMKWNAMQCNAMQWNAMEWIAIFEASNGMQCNAMECIAIFEVASSRRAPPPSVARDTRGVARTARPSDETKDPPPSSLSLARSLARPPSLRCARRGRVSGSPRPTRRRVTASFSASNRPRACFDGAVDRGSVGSVALSRAASLSRAPRAPPRWGVDASSCRRRDPKPTARRRAKIERKAAEAKASLPGESSKAKAGAETPTKGKMKAPTKGVLTLSEEVTVM